MIGSYTILHQPNPTVCQYHVLYKCGNTAQHHILPLELAASRVEAKLLPPNEHHQPSAPFPTPIT